MSKMGVTLRSQIGAACKTVKHTGLKRIVLLSMMSGAVLSSAPATAMRNDARSPITLRVECQKFPIAVPEVDKIQFGKASLEMAIGQRATADEKVKAFKEFDTMLTSMYGLRQPLSAIPDTPGRQSMARTAFLALNGYTVAAQMSHAAMVAENDVPKDAAGISGNMIYALLEPIDDIPSLAKLLTKTEKNDAALEKMPIGPRRFAKWILRGVVYRDPIAVNAALYGYCKAQPSAADNALLEKLASTK